MSTLSWAVVAREDESARAEWSRAAQDADVAPPRFVPWSAVVDSEAEFLPGEVVFAERLHPCVTDNPVGGQRARYAELEVALRQLDAQVTKAGARLAAAVEPTLLALDRTKRDEFLSQSGVPVLGLPDSAARGILRPRFAGSDDWLIDGSGTRLYRHRTRTGYEVWRAPGTAAGTRHGFDELVELLADDGIHRVASLHRVYLGNAFHDMRFAVVDGLVTHAAGINREQVVLREWYGGRRPEIQTFMERFGMERWARLVEVAERTATYFPGIRSLGVDLIMDNDSSEYVLDVDPFGASLPGRVAAVPNGGPGRVSVGVAVLRSLSVGS
ncbi:hypothetical protein [Catenulispora rubra]|uniref:hypothetical protein n=1 Tax=Catenulispora rubra TaxID=280293 RepID=UPI00189267BD|nr:hypothetical protein [Catenulispora rubra]